MAIIRPRLTDYHNILLAQEDVDFAIPFIDEDLPLCVDPFLLWKSPSQQDNSLHLTLINSFNYLGYLANNKKENLAIDILINLSECNEVGLGFSGSRKGARIGQKTANEIISLFKSIPEINRNGFSHFEEIQLYVDQISKDRISDITCCLLKSFLIDYTIDQCSKYTIPLEDTSITNVYNQRDNVIIPTEKVKLPINADTKAPILLVPKRWLRRAPWINSDDYVRGYYLEKVLNKNDNCPERGEILNFNRQNYDVVQNYIKTKELSVKDCKNDPLFKPIPVLSAKRKFEEIQKLPTGKTANADRKYEDLMCQLMSSLLYPHLDFASEQSRTDSGVLIRDLVFYNNRSVDFMNDIYKNFDSRQIVMELKNVAAIDRDHINQLNRYLSNEFGRFGVLLTRNPIPKAMFKNTIDLWAGQRKCLLVLTDTDIELMVNVFETQQRTPVEVLKKKYLEFTRACPG